MADTEDQASSEKSTKGGKKKLLLIAALALIALAGAAGAAYFLGVFAAGPSEAEAHANDDMEAASDHGGDNKQASSHGAYEQAAMQPKGPVFLDIPDVIVNLTSDDSRMRFLKIKVALEVGEEPAAMRIAGLMPRVLDSFQLYLRSLTVDELRGSSGLQRVKEELIARVNLAIHPDRVDDLLIKEMLVQ